MNLSRSLLKRKLMVYGINKQCVEIQESYLCLRKDVTDISNDECIPKLIKNDCDDETGEAAINESHKLTIGGQCQVEIGNIAVIYTIGKLSVDNTKFYEHYFKKLTDDTLSSVYRHLADTHRETLLLMSILIKQIISLLLNQFHRSFEIIRQPSSDT